MLNINQLIGFGFGAEPVTYATWNPADKAAGVTLSNGNLTATGLLNTTSARSTIGKSEGKWYWELTINAPHCGGGVATSAASLTASTYSPNPGSYTDSAANSYVNGVSDGGAFSMVANDVLGIAFDADTRVVRYYKNNVLQHTTAALGAGTYFAWCAGPSSYGGSQAVTANFGATALTYSPPSGHNAGLYD